MVTGRIVMAMGDITTQVAQYKMFSSWFAPSNGFAVTLGFEGASGKVHLLLLLRCHVIAYAEMY